MKSWMPWLLVVALVGALAYALGASNRPVPERMSAVPAPPLAAPESSPGSVPDDETQEAPPPSGPESTLTGIVREHTDVSQYTYVRLTTDGGETWAAVYRAPVKDGTAITIEHASAIHGFHSKELKRDFDTIWFGMLPGHETAPPLGKGDGPASAASTGAGPIGNTPRPGNAISIGDLAAKASSLDGQQVTVAGKVVKENDGIMGRNWIHLQDGTGSEAKKTNDLLVTTDGTAKVGDSVVATGTLKTRQDFGSGYAYDFMLEKATVAPAPAGAGH